MKRVTIDHDYAVLTASVDPDGNIALMEVVKDTGGCALVNTLTIESLEYLLNKLKVDRVQLLKESA